MGELLANPAFLGALAGLALGVSQYGFLSATLFPRMQKMQAERRRQGQDVAGAERSLHILKRSILFSDVLLFPVVGYFAGPVVADMLGYGTAQ